MLTHVRITLTFPCLAPYLGLNAWRGQAIHDIERKVCQKAHHFFLLVLWKLVSVRSPITDAKPTVKTSYLNRIKSYNDNGIENVLKTSQEEILNIIGQWLIQR